MITRRRGKDAERAAAKRLGGQRVGILGSEDVSHSTFSIEVKERKRFCALDWMSQAKRNAPADKIPLVVVHILNQRHGEDLVIWRMSDFQDWCGK